MTQPSCLGSQKFTWMEKKSGPPTCFKIKGKVYRKQKELAELQANYYAEKVEGIKNDLPRVNYDPLKLLKRAFLRWKPPGGKKTFTVKNFTKNEVLKMIGKLKKSGAFGHDEIDTESIKIGAKSLAEPISFVINLSLGTTVFPSKWKLGRVIPLLKSTDADKTVPKSFRPVSQLSLISKLTERVVQSQLLTHLEVTGQINTNHHAYRCNLSTTTALIKMMDTIATAVDQNLVVSSMSIDQSAAFDCVIHEILLQKLTYYGIGGKEMTWLESYLKHRSSYTVVGTATSSIRMMEQRVPQGSVLGPLLYLLYVNEFPTVNEDENCTNQAHSNSEVLFGKECLDCGDVTIYADDTQYSVASRSRMHNQVKLEETFQRVIDYLNSNGLEINQAKTTITEFMSKQKRVCMRGVPPELTAREKIGEEWSDKLITDSKITRILGINLQNNLTWNAHLQKGPKAILPGIRKLIGMLSKVRENLSTEARKKLVESLIISKLSYLICLWGNTFPSQLSKAQVCLNISARYVTGDKKSTSKRKLMLNCDWLDVAELAEYHTLLMIWKAARWGVPKYLRDRLTEEGEGIILTEEARLQMTAQAFRVNGTRQWNNLPVEIRTEMRLTQFKTRTKQWIKDRRTDQEAIEPG